MDYVIEPMNQDHRTGVIDIFNHYIENGFAAYSDKPLAYEYFDRYVEMTRGYPAYVARNEVGEVVGFAFLRPYHPAPTLKRTAEIAYFIHPAHTRRGLGRTLLERLVVEARDLDVDNILACISSRNGESLAFHRRHGFAECGRLKAAGKKFGEDFDIVWMQRSL